MAGRSSTATPSRRRKTFGFIPTLADVAADAGVAVSTASAVLTGKSYCSVSDDTRKRIFNACEKLGYKANPMARAIHSQQTHTIGLILPRLIGDGVLGDQLHVLDTHIRQAGYATVLGTHQYTQAGEVGALREQISRAVDGIILHPTHELGPELRELIESRFPLVTLSSLLPINTWNVNVDRFRGGYLQMQYLLQKGRRNILALMPADPSPTATIKHNGRRRALTEAGLSEDTITPFPLNTAAQGRMADGMRSILDALDQGIAFDAVMANSDTVALGVMAGLHQRGVRIPDDVAVIGFDDDAYAAYVTPSLTTIRQPRQAGSVAFELLIRQIDAHAQGQRLEPQDITLQPELIVRQSA